MLTAESSIGEREKWCAREDLNLQALRHQILSLACLPFHHARNLKYKQLMSVSDARLTLLHYYEL